MKVLTLNWGHGPYSISKIIRDIEHTLKTENVEFIHVQESGKALDKNYISLSGWLMYRIYYVWAHVSGIQYGTGLIPYLKLKHIIEKENPDIVHVHCPNGFSINLYKLFRYLKEKKINTVITNHAEFFYTGNCSHAEECMGFVQGCNHCVDYKHKLHSYFFNRASWAWLKMKKSFENFQTLRMVAVSPWVERRMKISPISNKLPSTMILNGVDIEIFCYHRELHKSDRTVLFVSANFTGKEGDIKGSDYFIMLAEKCMDVNIKFVVVGNDNTDEISLPANITVIGEVKDQHKLADYYSMADIVVITSRRETFGMVAAESLCCGTPVIAFKNGGTESVALPEYSVFVEMGDIDAMKNQLMNMIENDRYNRDDIAISAQKEYSKEKMAQEYLRVYREMCG